MNALVYLALAGLLIDAAPMAADKEQGKAPSFLAASDFKVEKYRGRVVLLNFWATYCLPCREEIPDLVRLREHFAEEQIAIIGISVDRGKLEKVRARLEDFAARYKMNYPIVLDRELDLVRAFGDFDEVPTSFLVDPEGQVVRTYKGARTFE